MDQSCCHVAAMFIAYDVMLMPPRELADHLRKKHLLQFPSHVKFSLKGVWVGGVCTLMQSHTYAHIITVEPPSNGDFRRFVVRGTNLLVLVRNQSVPHCLSIVERLSLLFLKVHLGRFHCTFNICHDVIPTPQRHNLTS